MQVLTSRKSCSPSYLLRQILDIPGITVAMGIKRTSQYSKYPLQLPYGAVELEGTIATD